jgi:hypothetical protein
MDIPNIWILIFHQYVNMTIKYIKGLLLYNVQVFCCGNVVFMFQVGFISTLLTEIVMSICHVNRCELGNRMSPT